ncbi:NAD dependent epimerase/dehydratase family protein [Synechococcus sp. A15-127]|uniref:NAD-dependent epimerase/dehydratase family protein n=1 Tax=Synechococcus sp. A15-127 TaxID=1050624 RepID=UPI0016478BEC|nr:NAD-dependent epimerase/dehydratase family protein [Synechococcus sp. A15-127]QNI95440.1 NAD dependent epimerase/dehydratase family protein [Synechococcus sp. A15-127]
MSKQKVLVIGSNSFSGSHFVAEALRAGHEVWGVSRSTEPHPVFLPYRWPVNGKGSALATAENFQFQAINLNSQLNDLLSLIDRVQPELVVNFAAQGMVAESWLNPTHWYRTNVVSQVALHDALRQKPFLQKYVHVTTPEVYGSTDGGWIKEHNHFAPSTPYAVSRAACDLHLHSFHQAYGFPVVFTRAANVYGPGQQLYRIIPRSLLSARTGEPMQLHGGGHSVRAFIHIEDVVRATLQLAIEGEPGSTWHLSTQESCSIKELVEQICKLASVSFSDLVESSEERLGKDQSYLLESSAMRQVHGWSDQVSLKEGIQETMAWVDANLATLKTLPWSYQHKS